MYWKNSVMICGLVVFFALMVTLRIHSSTQNPGEEFSSVEMIKKILDEKGPVTGREYLAEIFRDKGLHMPEENDLINLGVKYLEAGKPHLAAVVYETTVSLFPKSLTPQRLLAHSLYMTGDVERSIKEQAKMNDMRGQAFLAEFMERNKGTLASTAEEVIERCIEATGGRAAWESVRTMVVKLTVQSTSGDQPRLERMYKRPCLFRQGMEGSPGYTTTDGTKFWRVQDGKWSEDTNFHIRLASMDQWLTNYEDFGIVCEFLGLDHIGGNPVYHLARTYPDGFVEDLYFSASTHLLTEIKTDYIQSWPFMKSFMSQWNYRDVDGIKIPFVFIRNLGAIEPPHGGMVEEVQINVPLDDSLFLPPDHKK